VVLNARKEGGNTLRSCWRAGLRASIGGRWVSPGINGLLGRFNHTIAIVACVVESRARNRQEDAVIVVVVVVQDVVVVVVIECSGLVCEQDSQCLCTHSRKRTSE
jgi:hypothetical protein